MKKNRSLNTQYHIKNGSITKAIFSLAIPIAIANLITSFYSFIDAYFVGQISDTSLAAVSISFSITFMFYSFGTGLRLAVNTLISKNVGEKNYEKASETFTIAIIASILFAVVFFSVGYLIMPSIVAFIGGKSNDPLLIEYVINYTRVVLYGILPIYLFFTFQGQKQAIGDTITPVVIQSISVLLNIILDYVFINILSYGVTGAAIATIISQYFMLLFAYFVIRSKNQLIKFSLKNTNFKTYHYQKLFTVALPAILNDFVIQLSFVILNANAAMFGTQYIAAAAVGNRYNQIALTPLIAISSALTSIVGQLFGAEHFSRIKLAFRKAIKLGLIIGITNAFLIVVFRVPLVQLLLVSDDVSAANFAYRYTAIICTSAIIFGLVQINLAILNGFSQTKISFVLNLLRTWIFRIPLFFLLVPIIGLESLWASTILSVIILYLISLPLTKYLIKTEGIFKLRYIFKLKKKPR